MIGTPGARSGCLRVDAALRGRMRSPRVVRHRRSTWLLNERSRPHQAAWDRSILARRRRCLASCRRDAAQRSVFRNPGERSRARAAPGCTQARSGDEEARFSSTPEYRCRRGRCDPVRRRRESDRRPSNRADRARAVERRPRSPALAVLLDRPDGTRFTRVEVGIEQKKRGALKIRALVFLAGRCFTGVRRAPTHARHRAQPARDGSVQQRSTASNARR